MPSPQPTPGLRLEVLYRRDLRQGAPYDSWQDKEFAVIQGALRELLLANPLGSDDDPVQIVGLAGSRPIGKMNLLYGEIVVHGEKLPILWGSGLVVPPEHRQTGIGLMLILAAQRLPYAAGAIGPSQLAYPIYQKLGWVDLVAPRYVLLRRSRPVLEKAFGKGVTSKASSAITDVGLKTAGGLLRAAIWRRTRGLTASPSTWMPEEFDPQLAGVESPTHCPRSAAWLNWLLGSGPRRDQRALYLVHDRGRATVVGYFIVSWRHHDELSGGAFRDVFLGSVKDWMSFDRTAATDDQIVLLAIRELMHRRLDAIDICSPDPLLGRRLKRLGFLRKGTMHLVFRPLPNTALSRAECREVDNWRFRPADGDYLLF